MAIFKSCEDVSYLKGKREVGEGKSLEDMSIFAKIFYNIVIKNFGKDAQTKTN